MEADGVQRLCQREAGGTAAAVFDGDASKQTACRQFWVKQERDSQALLHTDVGIYFYFLFSLFAPTGF